MTFVQRLAKKRFAKHH